MILGIIGVIAVYVAGAFTGPKLWESIKLIPAISKFFPTK